MESVSQNNRIAKNTLFLYIRMAFVLLVGLYTSRVVLNVLGVSDYGIYNVVAGFVSLFSFFNATLSSSLQRFYNFEGAKTGEDGITRVYSLGFRIHAILAAAIFIVLETFGIWYIYNVMVLPDGRLEAAGLLYQFSIASMMFVIMKIPYASVIIAQEKMDFFAIASIVEVLLRLGIALVLPYLGHDKLVVYGILQLSVSAVDFLLNMVYAKRKFKYLHIQKETDRELLNSIMSFSGWNLLGTVIFMLKGQGVNLVLNVFFGTVVNAARGVAFQVSAAITGFSSNISISFRPQMVSSYAAGNKKRAYRLFTSQSKICYCLLLTVITPVILEIDMLLHLWLGEAVPENANVFTVLVLIDAMICTLNTPVTQIVYATGSIKYYQLFTSFVNFFLLPLCWIALKCGAEAWTVFLITIVVSIINQLVALKAMHMVFYFSYGEYLKGIILPCLIMTLLVPILPFLISRVMADSIVSFLVMGVISLVTSAGLLFFVFLSDSEKAVFQRFIHGLKQSKDVC